jgi:hypothetical protein
MKFIVFALVSALMVGLHAADADVAVQQMPSSTSNQTMEPHKDVTAVTPAQSEVATKDIAAAPVAEAKQAEEKKDVAPKAEVPATVAPAAEAVTTPATTPASEAKQEEKKEATPKAETTVPVKPAAEATQAPATTAATQQQTTPETGSDTKSSEPTDAELEKFFEALAQEQKAATEKTAEKK